MLRLIALDSPLTEERSYLLHLSSAKQSKTREARVAKCMAQIFDGKGLDDQSDAALCRPSSSMLIKSSPGLEFGDQDRAGRIGRAFVAMGFLIRGAAHFFATGTEAVSCRLSSPGPGSPWA